MAGIRDLGVASAFTAVDISATIALCRECAAKGTGSCSERCYALRVAVVFLTGSHFAMCRPGRGNHDNPGTRWISRVPAPSMAKLPLPTRRSVKPRLCCYDRQPVCAHRPPRCEFQEPEIPPSLIASSSVHVARPIGVQTAVFVAIIGVSAVFDLFSDAWTIAGASTAGRCHEPFRAHVFERTSHDRSRPLPPPTA